MNPEPSVNWADPAINFRNMMRPAPVLEPAIDEIVSQIMGRKIYQTDPRLIKLICKWKTGKPIGSMEPDNFLKDPRKIEELKEVLNQSL
jgi:hypothetical protein